MLTFIKNLLKSVVVIWQTLKAIFKQEFNKHWQYDNKNTEWWCYLFITFMFFFYFAFINSIESERLNIIEFPLLDFFKNNLSEKYYIGRILGISLRQDLEFTVILIWLIIISIMIRYIGKIFSKYVLACICFFVLIQFVFFADNFLTYQEVIFNDFGILIKRVWLPEDITAFLDQILIDHIINSQEVINKVIHLRYGSKEEIINALHKICMDNKVILLDDNSSKIEQACLFNNFYPITSTVIGVSTTIIIILFFYYF